MSPGHFAPGGSAHATIPFYQSPGAAFPPTAGRVLFFGEDVTQLPPYERIRRGLRRTYQSIGT